MNHRRLPLALLMALAAASNAPARQEAGKKPNELTKAQAALEQSAVQAGQALLKELRDEPVAWIDVRPAVESPAAAANLPPLQSYLLQAFLREGLLLFPYEQERKLDVKYKAGKLSPGLPLGADDLKLLAERKVKYALHPCLVAKESSSAVMMDVYNLETGQIVMNAGVGPIPTKKFPLNALCASELLPARNVKVLSFAAANFGRQVDRGECWDLPANPLRAIGARVDGYVFGKEVPWEQGRPGDVITFGTSGETGGHVVVLFRWTKNKSEATLLHQNWGGQRKVMLANLGGVERSKSGQKFALWRP
jgi:hypothetical protein